MKIRIGLVGLPNVGKSSLLNALAQQTVADAANYPFCTIEPNVATLPLPDAYLHSLGQLANSAKTVPATMDWIDVAGLCKGAHRGEGLGNRFLGIIRECTAICHVVRVFPAFEQAGDKGGISSTVHHVSGKVDPVADAEVVNLELLMADLDHVQRRLTKTTCHEREREVLERVREALLQGIPARAAGLDETEKLVIKSMGLLTLKQVLYCFNVDEVDFTLGRSEALLEAEKILQTIPYCDPGKHSFALICAKLETELSSRSLSQQLEYLASLLGLGDDIHDNEMNIKQWLSSQTLPLQIRKLLGLSVAYTGPGVPPERSRTSKAHLFRNGSLTAHELAGRLHGEIQKGFLRAEAISAPLLLHHGDYNKAREAGDLRMEGRDYIITDNDVVLIKWK